MDVTALVVSMSSMGGLGALFAIGLILANWKLHVDEDPRVYFIIEELPGANCGGCGYPGCNAFAERILDSGAPITACPVMTAEGVEEIAKIMGVEAEVEEDKLARILCKGGNYETAVKGEYLGIKTCLAGHLTFGADKLCQYGCLGFGDCVSSCPFGSIEINANGLPEVNEETCTGCGNCEGACPRNIIEVHPKSRNIFVFCKSQDEAKFARTACIKACIACKSCVKGVEEGQIVMKNNLAVIDYDLYGVVNELPTKKCANESIALLTREVAKVPAGEVVE
ncbi:MAG: RnfABCDGE type electron transport complex subunit B [Proteobacteria bacterium]|nr:RnfABCDGE type electron transport complex subunit B [Pseudomonadota bacterium]